jgi:hypothetical protein
MEQVVATDPKKYAFVNTYGLILYRAGNHSEAIRILEVSMSLHGAGGTPYDWLFLAMAHYQLGHDAEAHHWLDLVGPWVERARRGSVKDRYIRTPLTWEQRLELDLFTREAKQLIGTGNMSLPADVFARP